MISGIVLAAGAAKRMRQQKLLLDFRGKPVLQWVLEAALASDLDEVICVVRNVKEGKQNTLLKHNKLRWIGNKKAPDGQSTSVIAGLKAVSPKSEAALFLVGDQPLVNKDLINALIGLFRKSAVLIVAPIFQGQTRNPVLFHRELFLELLGLTGDRGGKALIQKHREKVALLEWQEDVFLDIDVWKDYETLNKR